jgi:FkbM family methyltransferase
MGVLTDARRLLRRSGIDVVRWPHRPESGVIDWALAEVIRSRGINCVIDVGGNRGQFAQRLRTLGYAGRIVSFEPSPTVLPEISAAAARDQNWTVRPVGLSSRGGEGELRLHREPQLNSLLDDLPGVIEQIPKMELIGTATVALSTLAAEFPLITAGIAEPRVLLKSDTQGHDMEVLRGAGDAGLDHSVLAVLVELAAQPVYRGQPAMTAVMDLIMNDGFAAVAFEPLFESSDGLRMVELDGLFMRPAVDKPDWGYDQQRRPGRGVPIAAPATHLPRNDGRPPARCESSSCPTPTLPGAGSPARPRWRPSCAAPT